MDEDFEIPVHYKGQERTYTARLLTMGYTYKIEVDLDAAKLLFDRDEEKKWRAMIDPDHVVNRDKIDKELVQVIAVALEELLG